MPSRRTRRVLPALAALGFAAFLFPLLAPAPAQAQGPPGGGQFGRRPPFAFGTVTAVDAGSGTITITPQFGGGSQTIQTQGMTQIVSQAAAAVSDLKVGDQIQVQGIPTGITASSLTIGQSPFTPGGAGGGTSAPAANAPAQAFASATGTVATVSPLTLTLSGSVTLTLKMASGAKVTKYTTVALSSVKVGDRVVAAGQTGDDGAFAATAVGVNVDMGGMGMGGRGGRMGGRRAGPGGPPDGGAPPERADPPPAGPPPPAQ